MTIIDVRTKQEYDQQRVDGALWFDVMRIAQGEIPDIPKNEEIILYCRSGARSLTAMHLLKAKGFTNVISGGGLGTMAAQGYEVIR